MPPVMGIFPFKRWKSKSLQQLAITRFILYRTSLFFDFALENRLELLQVFACFRRGYAHLEGNQGTVRGTDEPWSLGYLARAKPNSYQLARVTSFLRVGMSGDEWGMEPHEPPQNAWTPWGSMRGPVFCFGCLESEIWVKLNLSLSTVKTRSIREKWVRHSENQLDNKNG